MKYPYGICNFGKIIQEDYFYIDRTGLIPLIEDMGQQLMFLRPVFVKEDDRDSLKFEQFSQSCARTSFGGLSQTASLSPQSAWAFFQH